MIAQIARDYEEWSALLGYRLRPELGATFESMAALLDAMMRGLVLMAPTIPEIATRRVQASPFGALEPAEWSQPALAIAAIVTGFPEPDPAIDWDEERRDAVRQRLL